jgi:hypothetical protein
MIKPFVKKTSDEIIYKFNSNKFVSEHLLQDVRITDNSVCSNLRKENVISNSKLKGTLTNLLFESKFLKTQIQEKGFDLSLIGYLLEPDDSYLKIMVHKPYE